MALSIQESVQTFFRYLSVQCAGKEGNKKIFPIYPQIWHIIDNNAYIAIPKGDATMYR